MEEVEVVARQLRRHATRRNDGVPTVSVLVGEVGPLVARLHELLRPAQLALLTQPSSSAAAFAETWLKTAAATQDLVAGALRALGPERRDGEAEARAAWRARSAGERARWLELAIGGGEGQSAAAARWLLDYCREDAPSYRARGDAVEAVRGLTAWLPSQDWPALCLLAEQAAQLEQLVALALALPALTLLAVVPSAAFARFDAVLERRARALLREGLIATGAPPRGVRQQTSGTAFADAPSAGSVANGPLQQLRAEAAMALHEARRARACADAGAEPAQERARSLAERLLYELLQQDAETRGLFELNALMPFAFGPRQAEVDLVSAALELAIEIDGYHHFTEAAAYPRDRRKDVLLQSQGYWVARYLASDVVEQAEEVVGSVKELVRKRGGRTATRGEDS